MKTTPIRAARSNRLLRARNLGFTAAAILILLGGHLRAATEYARGNITWDNGITANQWATSSDGTLNQVWTSGNNAVFEVSAGTVTVASTGATVDNMTFTINGFTIAGGTLTFSGTTPTITLNSANVSVDPVLAGTAGVTISGTGAIGFFGNSTYTGGTIVASGTLKAGNATALGASSSAVTVQSGGTLSVYGVTMTATNPVTLNGTGAGGIGAMNNTNASGAAGTYPGLVSLGSSSSIMASNGTLTLSNTGTITGAGFNLTLSGTTNGCAIASSIATGSGALIKQGTGSWSLSGVNTYTGGTTISAGALSFANTSAIPATGTVAVAANATLGLGISGSNAFASSDLDHAYAGAFSGNLANVTMAAGACVGIDTTQGSFTYTSSVPASSYGLTKIGPNTLTLTGANSFSGTTNVIAGTLEFGGVTALYDGTAADWTAAQILVYNGGTFAVQVGAASNGFTSNSINTLQTNLKTSINQNGFMAGSALGLDTTNATGGVFTYNTAIGDSTGTGAGSVGLTKLGSGTLIVGGANTYSGATTLTGGTLQLASTTALPAASTLIFNGSGVVNLNGNTQTVANLTFPGLAAGTTSITSGSLTVTGAGGLNLSPLATGSGAVTVDLSGLTSFVYSQPSMPFTFYGAADANSALNLAETNTITASAINIATGGFSAVASGMTATVTLGQTNFFNTSTFQIGGYHNAAGTVTLNAALTSPALRLRGTGGGVTPVTSVIVGDNSNGASPGNFTLDTTAGSIDAIVTNLYAVETLNANYIGNVNMAAGTVNCGTLFLNYASPATSATTSANFNQNAGTVLAGAVDFNNGNDTGTPTLTSTYNLGPASGTITSGLLSAQTVTVGSPTMVPNTASQATFNFYNGTIQNYDPAVGQSGSAGAAGAGSFSTPQNLTISGATGGGAAGDYRTLNIVLAATGTQNFYAESGYAISVQPTALISGSGGLICNGPGVVSLAGAHTYSGPTTVSNGTLALTGGGSIADTPTINLLNGAAFDVTGNSSGFTLASSQTLSNTSASTGKLAGNLNVAAGALSISYTNGVPAFSIANGTLTPGSGSIFTINNPGAPLGAGNYLMISSLSGGSVAGTLPANAIVNGNNGVARGLASNMTASWSISGGALYLVVTPSTATVATTVALSTGSNPSVAGQSLTLTATIKVGGSTATGATGTVTFFDGTTAISGPIALSNGVATFTSSTLAAGSQSITAVYSGDGTYVANPSSALAETVYPFTVTPESITFSTSNPAAKVLNTSFCGLSYEKSELTSSLFVSTNTSLIAIFGQIAPAVLRIGGNSVDTTCWGGLSGLTPITSAQVDAFAGFVNALPAGWRVIYGINMSVNTPSNCAAEAAYVAQALGSRLLGFEIGNECDLYHSNGIRATTYNYSQFDSQWQALASAITSTVPGYVVGNSSTGWTLTGSADSNNAGDYAIPFASSEAGVISLLTTHYYRANGQSPSSTIAFLLTPDTVLPTSTKNCVAAAASNNLPLGYRCTECGSYYNGGAPNVSDAYGTALWALDFMFTEALNGSQGINFHGGGDSTGYTPIADNGVTVVQARPEFYGLKMFSLVSQGTVTPATITPSPTINFTAYVVQRASGGSSTVLVNKETATSVQATINLGASVTAYQTLVLTGPNLSATSGYTLGGAPIDPSGSWAGGFQTAVVAPGGQVTVTVPPMTAFLINPLTNVTMFNWLGGLSSTWTATANWDSNGIMPTNATTSNRLNVLNGSGNDCYYNFPSVSTTNNSSGATSGFAIGNSTTTGRFHITAGIFNSGGGDIVGAGYGSNTLMVDGGTYLTPSLTLGSAGNSINDFQISAGSAIITSLTSAAGTSVVSLTGGTLTATSIGLTGGVANSLQFNGGTLQAAASSPAFIAPAPNFTALVSAGGAVINDGGYSIGITAPLLADPNSAGGGLTKTGTGKLTLGAANTYTGNTIVSAGALALTGSGALADSPVINVQNGATFDVTGLAGGFALAGGQTLSNTSSASGSLAGNITAASGGLSVSYVNGTPAFSVTQGSLTLGASTAFSITNLGAALIPGSYSIVTTGTGGNVTGTAPSSVTITGAGLAYGLAASLSISNGNLVLTVSPNSGYSSWLYSYYPSLADKTPLDAPAGDNIPTLMKYVLNANPSAEGFSSLPGVNANGASVIFTFTQLAASASVTSQVFEYSPDLANWTSINVTPPTGAQVQIGSSVSTPTGPARTITITIPKGGNTQVFGRLSVTLPP